MLNAGKRHAALVLTKEQKKQLAEIVGRVRNSGATVTGQRVASHNQAQCGRWHSLWKRNQV